MSVTFNVTLEMDQEEWQDHCWGSGWTMYSWWEGAADDSEGIEASFYDDADDPDSEVITAHLTWQDIAEKCSELAAQDPFVARQLQASDFDADGMDRVMQYAFIGEVRYG
jgi:hypothetical protein